MAFRSQRVPFTATPAVIFEAQFGDLEIWINALIVDGAIGADDLQGLPNPNGFRIEVGGPPVHLPVKPGDQIYGVRDSSSNGNFSILIRST